MLYSFISRINKGLRRIGTLRSSQFAIARQDFKGFSNASRIEHLKIPIGELVSIQFKPRFPLEFLRCARYTALGVSFIRGQYIPMIQGKCQQKHSMDSLRRENYATHTLCKIIINQRVMRKRIKWNDDRPETTCHKNLQLRKYNSTNFNQTR